MQKTAAQQAYNRFRKYAMSQDEIRELIDVGAIDELPPDHPYYGGNDLDLDQLNQLADAAKIDRNIQDFQDPFYESPLERKRKMQGAGATLGSGAGVLGGALAGSLLPSSTVGKVLGGVGGGLGGLALGGLGGWGAGTLMARARMGQDYPKEAAAEEPAPEEKHPVRNMALLGAGIGGLGMGAHGAYQMGKAHDAWQAFKGTIPKNQQFAKVPAELMQNQIGRVSRLSPETASRLIRGTRGAAMRSGGLSGGIVGAGLGLGLGALGGALFG